MTAHILVPSLDEEKPATLSPAIVRGLLREELDFNGVILSDDLEMKAIADAYTVPDAAVRRSRPAATVCSSAARTSPTARETPRRRWPVLEALVHAVEDGRIPFKRAEDALARNRSAKERFLAAPVAPGRHAALRELLGNDEHRRIADEMSRYL
mgnify:CR=1 FL=1